MSRGRLAVLLAAAVLVCALVLLRVATACVMARRSAKEDVIAGTRNAVHAS